ncbi:hypothetical protein [Sphingomonas zeicaulis]|uniref:hypothetical protein n=1 Tax=Sphingomonas zeicaulis TaxID=1632740 RepID=UPI003D1D3CD6
MINGLLHPSRLNPEIHLAIADHAVAKLAPMHTQRLDCTPGMGRLLYDFQVAPT